MEVQNYNVSLKTSGQTSQYVRPNTFFRLYFLVDEEEINRVTRDRGG